MKWIRWQLMWLSVAVFGSLAFLLPAETSAEFVGVGFVIVGCAMTIANGILAYWREE